MLRGWTLRHGGCFRFGLTRAVALELVALRVRLIHVLTVFGVVVLTFMMLMYALERRGPGFVLAFALGCALSSTYGFLAGTWPFGVVEAIWAVIALRRYGSLRPASPS
jgi:hypothetical protein